MSRQPLMTIDRRELLTAIGDRRILGRCLSILIAFSSLFPADCLAQTALEVNGPSADKLDILLVPSHYYGANAGANGRWVNDAAAFKQRLLQHDFFSRFRKKINIYRLDASTANDFRRQGTYWVPDQARIRTFARTQAPFLDFNHNDQIIFVIEAAGYAADPNRTPGIGVTRGDPNILSIQSTQTHILIHEFGHSFGGLGDEYPKIVTAAWRSTYPNIATDHPADRCSDHWSDLTDVVFLAPGTAAANNRAARQVGCFESQDPNSPGRLFKPSRAACVMDQINDRYPFCPVCQRHLVTLLDRFTTSRRCALMAGEFRDRNTMRRRTGLLMLADFDRTPTNVAISAESPGAVLADQYAAAGLRFTSGVIFGEPNLPFSGISRPNLLSNSAINLSERSLVAGYFVSPVCAVGIHNTGARSTLRVFDEGYRLIREIHADANTAANDFVGIVSGLPIHRIEFDFHSGLGFGGDDLRFGVAPAN